MSEFKLSIKAQNSLIFSRTLELAIKGLQLSPETAEAAKVVPNVSAYLSQALRYMELASDSIEIYEQIKTEGKG
ncbi:MAG: hypothetical protein HC785_32875 [Calothrix sp. CSU_2_0]|nr:hypothetical protein [Calothrix sp. CSU_2_0]